MARKPRDVSDEEQQNETPYQSAPAFSQTDVIDAGAELVNESPMRASAVARDGIAPDVPAPPRFMVQRDQYVMSKGGRTLLRAGKIVDEHNFDLTALRSQGVMLEQVA